MPRSSPGRTKTAKGMQPSSQKLDVIDNWLQRMLDKFPEKKTLTEQEIEDWHKDLGHFGIAAIDFSFEHWRTSGLFFPLTGPILDMCISYDPEPEKLVSSNAGKIPPEQYGQGYNETDMHELFKIYVSKMHTLPNRPITDGEINGLLDILDAKRKGGAPAWRR